MPSRAKLSLWLGIGGIACLVFAARLREIHLYTGDVPFNDQWKVEGADLLAPWVNGTLKPWIFFAPHFEHVPVWTRLLAWIEVVITGRWDPFVQTTVNAALYVSFLILLGRWLGHHLRAALALGLLAFMAIGSALPHAWENIAWGFQSQFPIALLCLLMHARGSFEEIPWSRRWWWAQAAGCAGLFSLASMWLAPLSVVLAALWIQSRFSRWHLVPLALTAAGLMILVAIRFTAQPGHAFAQVTGSPLQFLHAWLDLLSWPAGWSGALIILCLPLVLFILQLRADRTATAFDHTVMSLGFCALGQTAALAFARSHDYSGYVSRYGELLMILVLANALALTRLLSRLPRWRLAQGLFVLMWSGITLSGWWHLSTGAHAAYFHEHAAENARIRRSAVQAYLEHQDRSLLNSAQTRWVLYQVVDQVTTLLDNPAFRALLPHSLQPANPPDPIGSFVRQLQSRANWLGAAGGLLFILGAAGVLLGPRDNRTLVSPPLRHLPELPWLTGGILATSSALLFCWPAPFTFDRAERWRRFFIPESSVGRLDYQVIHGSQNFSGDRLVGANSLWPPPLRDLFAGTGVDGDAFTCTAWSERFPIQSPWLIVPYTGWPISHGNGLRLRIESSQGDFITEVSCGEPPLPGIGFWPADVRAHHGQFCRVVLYDGRDSTEPWVAAAPPIAAHSAEEAKRMDAAWAHEQLSPAHLALGRLALVSVLFLLFRGLFIRSRDTHHQPMR